MSSGKWTGRHGEVGDGRIHGEVGGRRATGTDRFVEEEASQHATVGEEGEKLKAALPAGFSLRGDDRDAGGELGGHGGAGGPREDAREGERRRNRGEMGSRARDEASEASTTATDAYVQGGTPAWAPQHGGMAQGGHDATVEGEREERGWLTVGTTVRNLTNCIFCFSPFVQQIPGI